MRRFTWWVIEGYFPLAAMFAAARARVIELQSLF
jgi:hypothetical protein